MNQRSVALLLDLENLMHRSFVCEALRTVERHHGQRPALCVGFGSSIHIGQTLDVANQLGIELIQTKFGIKNSADKALVKYAESLWPKKARTIVVGSGDRGFLKWFRHMREQGLRLECVAREHQICKEAQGRYDALYRLDSKKMNLPSTSDLRQAVIDCIPEIEAGPVPVDGAISLLRAYRICPKSIPGRVFFGRNSDVFVFNSTSLFLR